MKRKLIILVAVAALFVTAIAAPVGAFGRRSLRAHMDLDFNLGIVTGEGAAPTVSWVGTLEFRGGTYGIVFFPHGPPEMHGEWAYFQETVRIYEPDSLSYTFDGSGVITAFTEGNVVVEFNDKGWVSPRGTGFAWGNVTATDADADSHGVFSNVDVGDRIFWYGRYLDEAHMNWGASFRIFTRG